MFSHEVADRIATKEANRVMEAKGLKEWDDACIRAYAEAYGILING